MTTTTTSLRERSKARRRAAIQRSALRLFAERGYDNATVADIAEDAEVAPRTVSGYFASKVDIAMSTVRDSGARLVAVFAEHPDQAFTEVIDIWLRGEFEHVDPDLAPLTAAMFEANPGLRALAGTYRNQTAEAVAEAFVAETGLCPEDPLLAVVGAAVNGALTEYIATGINPTADEYQPFLRCLRAIVHAARTP